MPANFPTSEKALEFQLCFIQSGGIPLLLSMLSKASFLSGADIHTKRFDFSF
jgi:ubiquitin carboxyl-terminal hydrolase 9/24